jgi:hypothetical protein
MRRPELEIRIQSPQTTSISGETIRVEVTVRNTGAEPVTLALLSDPYGPQPYFVLRGPSFAKPYRFHWSGNPPKPGQTPRDVRRVAPGESLKETLTLPAALAFPVPGAHELYATYEWNGAVVESNRISLKMEAPGPPVFRIVGRTPLSSELGIQALSVNGPAIYLATFYEDRPDLGETSFAGLSRLASIDPGATDFFAPWCQTAQAGVIGPRFGWRAGIALTVAGYRKLPQRIELPFTPRVHGPSLMGANGDIELVVTDAPGTRLALVRFPNVGYNQAPPPARVIWTRDVPEPISDLTATINPAGARHVVLRQGSSIRLVTWDDAGPRLDPPIPIEGRPVSAVAPALHVSTAGVVRASVLTADAANPRKLALTEIIWKTGAPAQTNTAPPFELQTGIRTGTIAYSMSAVEPPRREWVFVLESHRVQSSKSEGKAHVPKRESVVPPQLLVMRDLTYHLELRRKPELNAID